MGSFQLSGTARVLGFPGTFTVHSAAERLRLEWDISYIKQIRAFDGSAGWETNASTRELLGHELDRLRHLALGFQELTALASPSEPCHITWTDTYEEGPVESALVLSDWRQVTGRAVPHQIEIAVPDLPMTLSVENCSFDLPLDSELFASPNLAHLSEPPEISLATIPKRVYTEPRNQFSDSWARYWGIPFAPLEEWFFDLVVDERQGRWVEPQRAVVKLWAGGSLISVREWTAEALRAMLKSPVTRFSPQAQVWNVRLGFREYANLGTDRITIDFEGDVGGRPVGSAIEVPIETYRPKHRLLFPVRGDFIVWIGHDFFELSHVYEWSQHHAYDIVGVGPDLQVGRSGRLPAANVDYWCFGNTEVVAPADGVVVTARNDVPDDEPATEYLLRSDPITAIGGNLIVIDHGEGEYSLLAHNRCGSVSVRAGDRVRAGQPIARMGASGSPGHPHLHYQLQSGPGLFDGDGLPSEFENLIVHGHLAGPARRPRPGRHYRAVDPAAIG